jgi:arylsulfatase A-like enzyme
MQKLRNSILIFLFLLLLYSLLRLLFYQLYFLDTGISWQELASIAYWGMRLDASAIFYSNVIFFICYFLLHDVFSGGWKKQAFLLLLCFINLPLLAVNIIDLAYYRFNLRRSTIDLFRVIPGSLPAMGAFWKQWWWLFILFLALSVLVVLTFRTILKAGNLPGRSYLRSNVLPCVFFLLITGCVSRGFSGRPIIPSTPLLYLPPQYQPLATNSSITIMYSMLRRQSSLEEKNYYTAPGLDSVFNTRRVFHPVQPFSKMNVVVFILESFCKEYMDKNDRLRAKTPFLDSIMAESIVCNNAYANGLESNKGIVAILAGMPSFLDEPLYYSPYSNNKIRGIGTLLKEKGYTNSFFMGAEYDHFGFARFARMVGIDHYYSMDDYGNHAHYDGNWGVYDHYFLPFAAKQLIKMDKPFFSTVFTISTHFPYKLPDTLKKQFTISGQGREQNSMSYLDYSLRLFFNEIKQAPWYNNTLFVFSADHNLFWYPQEKQTLYKAFRIPIFFHLPGRRGYSEINQPVQQLDIIPSVLDILHYPEPFMSFGNSVFDTLAHRMVVNRIADFYQVIDSSSLFGYKQATEQPAYLYHYRSDTALRQDLLLTGDGGDYQQMEGYLRAVMQYYNYSLLKDKLYIK